MHRFKPWILCWAVFTGSAWGQAADCRFSWHLVLDPYTAHYSGLRLALETRFLQNYDRWAEEAAPLLDGLSHAEFRAFIEMCLPFRQAQQYAETQAPLFAAHNEALNQSARDRILAAQVHDPEVSEAIRRIGRFFGDGPGGAKPLEASRPYYVVEAALRAEYILRYPDFLHDPRKYEPEFKADLWRAQWDETRKSLKPPAVRGEEWHEAGIRLVADLKKLSLKRLSRLKVLTLVEGRISAAQEFTVTRRISVLHPEDVDSLEWVETAPFKFNSPYLVGDIVAFRDRRTPSAKLVFVQVQGGESSFFTTEYSGDTLTAEAAQDSQGGSIRHSISLMLLAACNWVQAILGKLARAPATPVAWREQLAQAILTEGFEDFDMREPQLLMSILPARLTTIEDEALAQGLPDWTVPLQEQAKQYFRLHPHAAAEIRRSQKQTPLKSPHFELSTPDEKVFNVSQTKFHRDKAKIVFKIAGGATTLPPWDFLARYPVPADRTRLTPLPGANDILLDDDDPSPVFLRSGFFEVEFKEPGALVAVPLPPGWKVQRAYALEPGSLVEDVKSHAVFIRHQESTPLRREMAFDLQLAPFSPAEKAALDSQQRRLLEHTHVSTERLRDLIDRFEAAGFRALAQALSSVLSAGPPTLFGLELAVRDAGNYSFDDSRRLQTDAPDAIAALEPFLDFDGRLQYQCLGATYLLAYILHQVVDSLPGVRVQTVQGLAVQKGRRQVTAADGHSVVGLFLEDQLVLTLNPSPPARPPKQLPASKPPAPLDAIHQLAAARSYVLSDPAVQTVVMSNIDASHPLRQTLLVSKLLWRLASHEISRADAVPILGQHRQLEIYGPVLRTDLVAGLRLFLDEQQRLVSRLQVQAPAGPWVHVQTLISAMRSALAAAALSCEGFLAPQGADGAV